MRPICCAAILLAATVAVKAYATTILPVTISGTETFYFAPDDDLSLSFESEPPLTLTGSGIFGDEGTEYDYGYLSIHTNIEIKSLLGDQFIDLTGGKYENDDNPYISIDFNYDPNGLSTGTFYAEETDNTGYVGGAGVYMPGRNYRYASGTITQTVTPEPSSFALLGTGLLGAAGLLRRRYAGQGAA